MAPRDDYFVSASSPSPEGLPQHEVDGAGERRGKRTRDLVTLVVVGVMALLVFQLRPSSAPTRALVTGAAVRVSTQDGAGAYRFLAVDPDGAPVRWNPCAPVRYVVNLAGAPYGTSLQDVQAAFDRVTDGSGLTFELVGETDEPAVPERAPVHPERYGGGWAPVLVAWTDAGQVPGLAGDVVASAHAVPVGDPAVYVSGAIYLDRAHDLRSGFGRGRAWGTVLIHEAGHLIGLEHVDDETEVMHPGGERSRPSATVRWGVGDREGLRLLGLESGCQSVPAAPSR